ESDQSRETDHQAKATDGPDPFAADAVGEMAEIDLAGNAEQADDAKGPDADAGREADVEQEFGLVHLHRVPDVQPGEIAGRDPPAPRGAERKLQCPVGIAPKRTDDGRD